MRVELIRCEVCKKEHDAQYMLPSDWIATTQNDRHGCQVEGHFCSKECLAQWTGVSSAPAQQDMPQSKIRRFMLVDGETADEVEGVMWGNGHVSLDPEQVTVDNPWFYRSWEEFGQAHPGDGITWIDQEVKADAS